jgi:hypothetical protein
MLCTQSWRNDLKKRTFLHVSFTNIWLGICAEWPSDMTIYIYIPPTQSCPFERSYQSEKSRQSHMLIHCSEDPLLWSLTWKHLSITLLLCSFLPSFVPLVFGCWNIHTTEFLDQLHVNSRSLVMLLGQSLFSVASLTEYYICLLALANTFSSPGTWQPGQLSQYSDWLWAGWLGFDSQWGLGIFLSDTMSRPALGPTQPLI